MISAKNATDLLHIKSGMYEKNMVLHMTMIDNHSNEKIGLILVVECSCKKLWEVSSCWSINWFTEGEGTVRILFFIVYFY